MPCAVTPRSRAPGLGTLDVEAGDGRRLHLALEDDPLEIFLMGARFNTCLSPGSMNYFSVFANAADINKRVLYVRDDAGKVLGRCLLALTAQGELLLFTPYSHDGALGIAAHCEGFADRLARAMGTKRTGRGKVPVLVASAWYDDGPRDLGGEHAALEEGSPLRQRLATLRPGELVDELRRALKPAHLNEITLPLVLDLPEIQQRPDLAVPLLRLVAECPTFPDEPLVRVARLAVEAGSADLVRRLLLKPLAEVLPRVLDYESSAVGCADLLLRIDPARLLAVLRRTRARSIHDWPEEVDGRRLESAAAAFEALFRPRQAQSLWRRLATSDEVNANREQRQRAQEALERTRT